jgi:hypothetical protein
MSKDPAFLFYSSDFLTGTMFMDNEQVGKFIRLICAQHQKGRLTEKDMLKICGTHDEDIFEKFALDGAGLYYNERLEQEVEKRKAYSESRRNNRKKKEDMLITSKTYVLHMENENENEIKVINDKVDTNEIKEQFEKVWIDYTKVGPKKLAFERFKKLTEVNRLHIINHVPRYIQSHRDAQKMDFIPHFATYITQQRWEDELPYKPKIAEPVPTKPIKYFNIEDYDK